MRTGREPYEITVGLSNSRTPDERPERGRGAVEREHGASRNLRAPGSKSLALNSLRGQDWALGGLAEGRATAQSRTGWALRPCGPVGEVRGPRQDPRGARARNGGRDGIGPRWGVVRTETQHRGSPGTALGRRPREEAKVPQQQLPFSASGRKCRSARAPRGPAERSSSSREPTPTPYSGPAPPLPAPSQGLKTTPKASGGGQL